MSQAHIPQPNSQSSAPAEAFDSTADAPHGPTVAGIGVPAGPPQEIPVHTGAQNTFDITIHRQFIPMDTVTWSTAQVKGTLIWFTPVHPSRANPILSYLTPLYNAWGGPLEYNFKIAGTGFHAGAIAIVRIPPNRHPSEFTSPSQWGPFEYVVMDPKMLEVASLEVSDQRPIAYHYNPLNLQDSYSFGGYLAMYVLVPLNTSSTGSQTIAIQVFNRPGATFQFSQLITPSIGSPQVKIPQELDQYLSFSKNDVLANMPIWVESLYIQPSTTKQVKTVYNCFSLTGEPLSKYSYGYTEALQIGEAFVQYPGFQILDIELNPFTFTVDYSDTPLWQYIPADDSPIVVFTDSAHALASPSHVTALPVPDTKKIKFTTQTALANYDEKEGIAFFSKAREADYTENVYSAKGPDESFVSFGAVVGQNQLVCSQTRKFARAAAEGYFQKLISPDQALLFILRDKSENLNVGYVKLYAEGFFTAKGTPNQVIYPIQNMQLIFDSYILRTDPIPTNATYNLNALAIRQKYALSRLTSAQRALLN